MKALKNFCMRIDVNCTQYLSDMYLQITKNIQFTRNLKVNGLVREFNFRKISGAPEELFHVDVVDDRGNRIMFRMQKTNDGHWRFLHPTMPGWIMEAEDGLHKIIEDELQAEASSISNF
jgi:hypothetical protein